jgi:hypothetical protein
VLGSAKASRVEVPIFPVVYLMYARSDISIVCHSLGI